jgi:hypothetical protein
MIIKNKERARQPLFHTRKKHDVSLLSSTSRPTLESNQPPTQWVRGVFPGGKAARSWRWPLSYTQRRGQETYSYTYTPPHAFVECCLVKNQRNFSFYRP